MPTVEHLVTDPEQMADRLPDAIRSVSQALDEGDYEAADELLDEALGAVLSGPGYRQPPPRMRFVPVVLWVCCGILLALVLGTLLWH